jgi:hypothetical protein
MLTNTFKYVGLAYKYLLTLSVTQVTCERSFSALKTIKTYLRSTLSQENLEALMLMKLDYELVLEIDNNFIIDKIAHHSKSFACNMCFDQFRPYNYIIFINTFLIAREGGSFGHGIWRP